jgi:hypothetical protein
MIAASTRGPLPLPPVHRNLPHSSSSISPNSLEALRSLFLFPQASSSPKLRFFAHTQTESLTAFRQPLANEKFGVIFTFARHLACCSRNGLRGELWPLPVRACHESLHGCTWHQKTQPASLARFLVVAMGAGAKIVCAAFARYDHFSAIRSVFLWLCFPLFAEGGLCWGVSFDSDYSGGSDASFLLIFEVCWRCFLLRGHTGGVQGYC